MKFCITILFIFFHSQFVLPQTDTTQIANPDSSVTKQTEKNNFFRQEDLKLKDLRRNLHQNHLGLNLNIPQIDTEGTNYTQLEIESMFNEDQLNGFKDSYSFLMKSEYKNLFKYDLGVVGKYLGLSENIMAIILAIISVAK